MKRLLSVMLVLVMMFSLCVTAFAASSEDLSDFNGRLVLDPEASLQLSAGTTYDIQLFNERANGNQWEVDEDYMKDFSLKMKVTDGKSYATAKVLKIDGEYYLRIVTKEFSGKSDRDFSIEFTVKGKKSPRKTWESGDIEFTILSDKNNVDETVTENKDEITVNANERVTIELEDDVYKTTVWFDDYAYVDLRGWDKKYYTFFLDYNDVKSSVLKNAPDDADLTFYNFRTATSFEVPCTVGFEAYDDARYVYQINDNGGLTAINATLKDDYLVFRTEKLGWYVVSDYRLNGAGNAATPSDGTSDVDQSTYIGTGTRVSVNGPTMSKSDLEAVYKEAAAGSTAVLFIEDNTAIRVEDLKAVQAAYPNRALCVVNRVNGKTTYQYRMTASQAAALKDNDADGVIALGMVQGSADSMGVFKEYFTNKVYVLGHNNVKSLNTNGYFAVDMSKVDLKRDNLRFYWYDAARNYYNPIQTAYKFDKYDYIYFTAPVGYDVVMSEGPLVLAK